MTTPFAPKVTVDARGSKLLVLRKGDKVPALIHGLVTRPGIAREVARLAVGCKFIDQAVAAGIIPAFLEALKVYDGSKVVRTARGSFWSGGTANANKDGTLKDDMPTVLPGHIAAAYPTIAFSTTPKMADTLAQNYINGGVVVDGWGTRLDYRQHLNIVFEPDITSAAPDWDFDLELYLSLMEGWMKLDDPIRGLIIGANGGTVARREFYGGLTRKIPLIVLSGSKRESDAFVAAFQHDNWTLTGVEDRQRIIAKRDAADASAATQEKAEQALAALDAEIAGYQETLGRIDRDLVSIVPINDSKALNTAFLDRGFLAEVADETDEDPNA